jgi:hypothetical protein
MLREEMARKIGRADSAYHRRQRIFSGSGQAGIGNCERGRSKNLSQREILA